MGMFILKYFTLLFLIISASLISTFAGRRSNFFPNNNSAEPLGGAYEDSTMEEDGAEELSNNVHERVLRVMAHDYGRYDPSPSLRKPRYKLIPN